jgi:hypothetical protein
VAFDKSEGHPCDKPSPATPAHSPLLTTGGVIKRVIRTNRRRPDNENPYAVPNAFTNTVRMITG